MGNDMTYISGDQNNQNQDARRNCENTYGGKTYSRTEEKSILHKWSKHHQLKDRASKWSSDGYLWCSNRNERQQGGKSVSPCW
jgi:hypothetical protein